MAYPATALVLGCGAAVGAAWTVGALVSVRDELGFDPRDADLIVGTSAGAQYGAMLAAGIGVDELLAMQRGTATHSALIDHLDGEPGAIPPLRVGRPTDLSRMFRSELPLLARLSAALPHGRVVPHWLQTLGRDLGPGGWVDHPGLRLVAMDSATGQRVAFGAPEAPKATLAQALHASWSVPGIVEPAVIGGRRYLDGGAYSTASADLAAGFERVIVIAPMASLAPARRTGAGRIEHAILRRPMTAGLRSELAVLRRAAEQVVVFTPGAEDLDAMGPNFLDQRRRGAALETALRTTRATAHNAHRTWDRS